MKTWELEVKCGELERENAALTAEVAELTELVRTLTGKVASMEEELRAAHRQAGRFSRRESQRVNEPKQPGCRAGQGDWSRLKEPSADEKAGAQTKCSVLGESCPICAGSLEDRRSYEHFEWDIPPVASVLTWFVGESGYCPRCRQRHYSMHPEQSSSAMGAASVSLGPRAKAAASDMKHHLGMSYGKIKDYFWVMFGLPVSRSGLFGADMRLAARASPVYQELIRLIRECLQVHTDETGWRIGLASAWLWVFTGKEVTVYIIRTSRGHEVVLDVLGKAFKGVLTSDGLLTYDAGALADWLQQKCLAHLLRRLAALSVRRQAAHVALAGDLIPLFKTALALATQRPTLAPDAFVAERTAIESRLDDLLAKHATDAKDDDGARMVKHLRKHQARLFTFLYIDGIVATNNPAESGLRPGVITRKTNGCNRSPAGADAHAILASVQATCRKRGVPVIHFLIQLQLARSATPSLANPGSLR